MRDAPAEFMRSSNLLTSLTSARILATSTLASSVIALCAGCAGRAYVGPASVEGPPVVAQGVDGNGDGDVVYVDGPPVVDFETYPTLFFGGDSVYYVGGLWYQHGPRGWAYYRQEPVELGRQREERWGRDHDARWAGSRETPSGQEEQRRGAPAPRVGATEAQPAERPAPPQAVAPRAVAPRAVAPQAVAPQPVAPPRRKPPPEAIAPKRAPRARTAPPPPAPPPERR